LFEQSHLKDVIQEFLTIIIQKGKDNTPSNSIILKVKQNQGIYTTNFPLHGERKIQLLDEELPHIFWKKLLEGKQPRWKYSSGLSQRNRKRVQYADDIQKNTVVEGDEVVKKRNKVANNSTNSPSLKAALIGKWLISLLINCFDLFLILYMQMVPLSEYRVAIIVGFP
jgi:chromodomain-helicase-DNA-binding protein 4